MGTRPDLSVLVPIHNEERRLPELIASLRAQTMPGFSVVLVDNASIDGTARILAACPEVRSGRWTVVRESRIGKFHALRSGNAFLAERFRSPLVALMDADTQLDDAGWLERAATEATRIGASFGFAYCLFRYTGVDHLPRLATAIRAGEDTAWQIAGDAGWYALGCCSVHPADLLTSYLERAAPAAEMDLRQSLHALRMGREAVYAPGVVFSPARRIVASPAALRRWSFYDRRYYRDRDINRTRKVDLENPQPVRDLDPASVERLLERRGRKIACRNVVPLALFEPRQGRMLAWVEARLSARARASLHELRREVASSELHLSDRFESLVQSIERRALGREMSAVVATMMRASHAAVRDDRTASATEPASRAAARAAQSAG
jgi:glycosyltransferase involved in cell wall biosynthesis